MVLVLSLQKPGWNKMVFDVVAKEIVSNSINTAICIDNDFEEPYSLVDNPSNPSFKIPKELYESFKKQNCILDFHKYIDLENWASKKSMILKNKDLLILDWQLTEGEPPFKDALEILLEAVKTDSLPFIYIYTEKTDLDEIAFYIYSYFSGLSLDDLEKKYDLFCNEFEEIYVDIDTRELFYGMKSKIKEIVLQSNDDIIKEIKNELFDYIKTKLGLEQKEVGEVYNKLFEIGCKNFNCNNENVLKNLGLFLNNGLFRDKIVSDVEIRAIEGEKYTYSINNTLVKIASKKINSEGTATLLVSAEQVYSDFSKTICKRPKNFLALLGLEMRNLYRNRCSIIGKDINDIDELAFFYHQKSLDPDENAFHDFLFNMWKDEVSSFLQDQNPRLFSELNDYKTKNEIDKKLITFSKNSDDVIRNLAKLNYYYSILRITHNEPRQIRFGDIFSIENVITEAIKEDLFLLCITPHCDCLRPEKIDNCFYFVGGKKLDISSGLKKGDTGFISYIQIENKIICIEWKTTPFTIHIPNESKIIPPIECDLLGKKIRLKHITWQKENYSQRIANQSFSNASRVGINLAGLHK